MEDYELPHGNNKLGLILTKMARNQSAIQLFLRRNFNLLELLPMLMVLVGMMLWHDRPGLSEILIPVGLNLLAVLYFMGAFLPMENANTFGHLVIPKIFSIGLSVGLVGIAFALRGFVGAPRLLGIAVGTIVISLLWGTVESMRTSSNVLGMKGYIRGVGIAFVAVWLLRKLY